MGSIRQEMNQDAMKQEMKNDIMSVKQEIISSLKNEFHLIESHDKAGKYFGLKVSSIPIVEGSEILIMMMLKSRRICQLFVGDSPKKEDSYKVNGMENNEYHGSKKI